MKAEFIVEIKKSLESKKAKLEVELKGFAARDPHASTNFNTNFPDYGTKEDENAAEVAQFSDNLSLEKTLEHTLEDVIKALERISKNTYGKCKYCGEEIDERRLKARPESSACVKCKEGYLHKA
jgi:RNA polymerase-binding transcription factor DksA